MNATTEREAEQYFYKHEDFITGGVEYKTEHFEENDYNQYFAFRVGRAVWTAICNNNRGLICILRGKVK